MRTRTVTGLLAAAVLIGLVFFASAPVMTSAILLCAVLASLEYNRLFFDEHDLARELRSAVAVLFVILVMRHRFDLFWAFFWMLFLIHGAWYVVRAASGGDHKVTVSDLMVEFFGYFYVSAIFGFLVPIALSGGMGRTYLLLLFLIVSLGDTAAYFIGLYFGKHLLAPQLSPKKTWEGASAAMVISFVATMVWVQVFHNASSDMKFACTISLLAVLGSILAQLGDLFESLLKRSRAKKDSGSLLPGHGGVLDRTDGLAFAAPFFYFYLKFVLERVG